MPRHTSYDVQGNKTRDVEITVAVDMYAPPSDRFYAHFGDFDIDSETGHGKTPLDAIVDLLDLTDA